MLQVVESVDIAFLDGCFYSAAELPGRDIKQIPHPMITDTMQQLHGLDLKQHLVVMIHLNHTNPVWRDGPQRQHCLAADLQLGKQASIYVI